MCAIGWDGDSWKEDDMVINAGAGDGMRCDEIFKVAERSRSV